MSTLEMLEYSWEEAVLNPACLAQELPLEEWDSAEITPEPSRPGQGTELRAEIARARFLVDEVGEEGDSDLGDIYAPETLSRAITVLENLSVKLWRYHGALLPVPAIGPGPNRSVDLYWRQPKKQLLINVPAGEGNLATFFGSNYSATKSKGSFPLDAEGTLLSAATVWLT